MKTLFMAIAASVMLVGCGPKPYQVAPPPKPEALEIRYTQDQLGICYAYVLNPVAYGYNVAALTYVPCEVLAEASKKKQEAVNAQKGGQ